MPTPPGVGSENLANPMFQALVGTANAALPNVDIWDATHDVPWGPSDPIFQPVAQVTVAQLLACINALQDNFKTLLDAQVDAQRITNADYAKTLVGLSQVATQGAVQFMLGKDQAYWMAVKTQADAVTARNQNEEARMRIMLLRAQFAKTKLELAATDSQFGVSEVNRIEALPAQVNLTKEQYETARAQTLDTRSDTTAVSGVIGGQKLLTTEQKGLVHEQLESQRANTLNTRQDAISRSSTVTNPDGTTESRLQGLLGVQNSLYSQQINSYRDDSKVKAAKLFSDLWMTQATVTDGTLPADYFRPPTALEPSNPYENVFKAVRNLVVGYSDPWTP